MNGSRERFWGVDAPANAGLSDLELPQSELPEDDPAPYGACDSILLIGTGDWTDERQTLSENALQRRKMPVFGANPDIVAPREAGFSVEPGHTSHRLADLADIEPEFYGKPFDNIFDLVFDRLSNVDRSRVVDIRFVGTHAECDRTDVEEV